MKTRKQNRNDKRTEIERFDWFIERIQTRVAFGWVKKLQARELSRINRYFALFILQNDWPIEQCLLHVRVFFGGKTKRPCFDLFFHWLIKQITNPYQKHFSRSCENRSIISRVHWFSFQIPFLHLFLHQCCKLWFVYGRQLAQEMKEVASQRQQEEEAFYRQQELMVDAENQRRRMISQEEQKLSDQRSRFVSVKDFCLNVVIHALCVCRWVYC